jgi:hypothetical protein
MTNAQMMAQFDQDKVSQDAVLDEIGQGVDRIGMIGQHIGDEADSQQVRHTPSICAACDQWRTILIL